MNNLWTTQPSRPEMPAASSPSTAGAAERFQPLELPVAEPFRTSKTFTISKLALGILSFVVAVISLGLITAKFTGSGPEWPSAPNIYLSFAIASIIWTLAEYITLVFRRDWRSICPVAHMGLHLILWIFAVIVVSLCFSDLAFWLYLHQIWESCKKYDCGPGTFPSKITSKWYFGIMGALTALNVMLLVLHFTLFIMACIETERRNVYGKKTKTRYLAAAPGPADGRMYYTPLKQPLQGNEAVAPHSQACSPPPVG